MKIGAFSSLIAACAFSTAAAPAWADCKQELAQLQGQIQDEGAGEISKDGSLAPLEGDDTSENSSSGAAVGTSPETTSSSNQTSLGTDDGEIAKDGSEVPLNTDTAGIAMSGQDAEAQQDDASAALAEKGPETVSQEVHAALARAADALEAGDEAGCLEAVEEARAL